MSPEQIRGQEVDARSDLYSVGVVLYLALSGDFPHPGIDDDDEPAILMAHLETPPLPLPMVVPDCSQELSAIVLRLLAKDPDERFQSAEEAVSALSSYLRGSIEPDHPLAKKMAHDRRTIAHKAVYEHSQSRRPLAPEEQKKEKAPAAVPSRPRVATAPMPAVQAPPEPVVPGREAIPPPPSVPVVAAVQPPAVVVAPPIPVETLGKDPKDPTSPWAHAAQASEAPPPPPAGPPSGSKTGPLPVMVAAPPKAPRVSSSSAGRSWEKERPGRTPRRLSLAMRQLLRVVAVGVAVGALGGLGVRVVQSRSHAPVAAAAASAEVPAVPASSGSAVVEAPATAAVPATAAPAVSAAPTTAPATVAPAVTAAPTVTAVASVARPAPRLPSTAAAKAMQEPAAPPAPTAAPAAPTAKSNRVFGTED